LDSQTIELIGQDRLAGELLRAGLEVAFPARDRGVDLIAYADLDTNLDRFVGKPIQMKAAFRRSFGIWKKYLKIHDLILAFVWHLDGKQDSETYALTCDEAFTVGEAMGWNNTNSWTINGGYSTTRPIAKLCGLLDPNRMTPDLWWKKITGQGRT
jgi:hypothetical protein